MFTRFPVAVDMFFWEQYKWIANIRRMKGKHGRETFIIVGHKRGHIIISIRI